MTTLSTPRNARRLYDAAQALTDDSNLELWREVTSGMATDLATQEAHMGEMALTENEAQAAIRFAALLCYQQVNAEPGRVVKTEDYLPHTKSAAVTLGNNIAATTTVYFIDIDARGHKRPLFDAYGRDFIHANNLIGALRYVEDNDTKLATAVPTVLETWRRILSTECFDLLLAARTDENIVGAVASGALTVREARMMIDSDADLDLVRAIGGD